MNEYNLTFKIVIFRLHSSWFRLSRVLIIFTSTVEFMRVALVASLTPDFHTWHERKRGENARRAALIKITTLARNWFARIYLQNLSQRARSRLPFRIREHMTYTRVINFILAPSPLPQCSLSRDQRPAMAADVIRPGM